MFTLSAARASATSSTTTVKGGESEAFRNYAWTFTNIIASALHLLGEEVTLAKLIHWRSDPWFTTQNFIGSTCKRSGVRPTGAARSSAEA